jgi:hypothetical protein
VRKALILARNLHQFMGLMKTHRLNPSDYKYVRDQYDTNGWWVDMPVILLEGYEYNPNYYLGLMAHIGNRFENIGFISEGEVWNETIIL